MASEDGVHYQKPGWFTKHVFNPIVAAMTRLGVSVWGSRVLRVRGRTSGEWRTTPVNLLSYENQRYLVAARGGELQLGRKTESIKVVELSNDQKPALLRAYLKRWKAEVGVFFGGVSATSAEEDVRR